jgi:large subunit ribosomal protein L15
MVVHKRMKSSRMRGAKTTHGFGAKKKHRGSGNRGGFGMAGSGKRADQKKPTILKLFGPSYYGKHGFKMPPEIQKKVKIINIQDLQEKLVFFVYEKLVTKEGDSFVVDLKKLGYDKLVGKGNVRFKFRINVPSISSISNGVKAKVEEKGGAVNVSSE